MQPQDYRDMKNRDAKDLLQRCLHSRLNFWLVSYSISLYRFFMFRISITYIEKLIFRYMFLRQNDCKYIRDDL